MRRFWERYPEAEEPLRVWYQMMKKKDYASPHDVKEDFSATDFLGGSLTVFNIGGNKFRLVVNIRYEWGKVFVRQVLTHEEYTKRSKSGTL